MVQQHQSISSATAKHGAVSAIKQVAFYHGDRAPGPCPRNATSKKLSARSSHVALRR
ncbi:hypothetical protein [Hallella mizrahii]|uniref:hypothetical protein n=1 Tax=Hallella mizrahii TaxID=2606637 RepID=UPI0012B3E5E5|nr:hypothetical protein [Hallella mizrahii]